MRPKQSGRLPLVGNQLSQTQLLVSLEGKSLTPFFTNNPNSISQIFKLNVCGTLIGLFRQQSAFFLPALSRFLGWEHKALSKSRR
jgi:hypothetical protein